MKELEILNVRHQNGSIYNLEDIPEYAQKTIKRYVERNDKYIRNQGKSMVMLKVGTWGGEYIVNVLVER